MPLLEFFRDKFADEGNIDEERLVRGVIGLGK